MADIEPGKPLGRIRLLLWIIVPVALAAGLFLQLNGSRDDAANGGVKTIATGPAVGGPFMLTDAEGRKFGSPQLAGKPFAIFFGFTRCPDVCPTTLNRMARLRKQMGEDADKFRIVFVSVDPGHDTPADIGAYLKLFEMPVIGLTGTEAELKPVEQAFSVYVAKVMQPDGDYMIDHTATIFLMDASGQFAGTIAFDEKDNVALEKLKKLVA